MKIVDCSALPSSAGAKSVAHGSNAVGFLNIYGISYNDGGVSIPLPYPNVSTNQVVQVYINGANIVINVAQGWSGYNKSYITLEYYR